MVRRTLIGLLSLVPQREVRVGGGGAGRGSTEGSGPPDGSHDGAEGARVGLPGPVSVRTSNPGGWPDCAGREPGWDVREVSWLSARKRLVQFADGGSEPAGLGHRPIEGDSMPSEASGELGHASEPIETSHLAQVPRGQLQGSAHCVMQRLHCVVQPCKRFSCVMQFLRRLGCCLQSALTAQFDSWTS